MPTAIDSVERVELQATAYGTIPLPSPQGDAQATAYGTIPIPSPQGDAQVDVPEERPGKWVDVRVLWAWMGPGWLMSMAYLDPGNLESDLQAGAYGGYSLLWVLLWSTVMGLVLQVLAARLGVVTGMHLAEHCRRHYPRWQSLVLWVMTELAIIGSDIQEVVGSAIAFKILFDMPLLFGTLLTGLDTVTFLALNHFGIRKLEAAFVAMIFCMAICFWVNYFEQPPDAAAAIRGMAVPVLYDYTAVQAIGILGAVIMPHNIYLHSALVLSRRVDRKDRKALAAANKYNAIESTIALAFSFLINFAVVAVFARSFFDVLCAAKSPNTACLPGTTGSEHTDTACMVNGVGGTCQQLGLAGAGEALESTLGTVAKYVWAIGLLAAGQASTMTGTLAGQHVMEGFLQLKVAPWIRVAGTRSLALGPALLVAMATDGNRELSDTLDEWLNLLQSVQLPFALLPVLHLTSSRAIMGDFATGTCLKVVVWILAAVVLSVNLMLVRNFAGDMEDIGVDTSVSSAVVGGTFLYIGFIVTLIYDDVAFAARWVLAKFCGKSSHEYDNYDRGDDNQVQAKYSVVL